MKELPPPETASSKGGQLTSSPLPIFVGMVIHSVVSIDTVDLKFTADFTLGLTWHDSRLDFNNLNAKHQLNVLGEDVVSKIWTPKLLFSNVLGSLETKADANAVVMLVRNESSRAAISGTFSATEG